MTNIQFKQVCIGFIPDSDMPTQCTHYSQDGYCNFFLNKDMTHNILCDDLMEEHD